MQSGSESVLFAAAPKRRLVDAEDVGRFLEGAGIGQDSPDVFFFDPIEADRIPQPDRPVGPAQVLRQVVHIDPISPAEDDGPLDDVPQFADISGPMGMLQDLHRLGGETRHRSVAGPAEKDHEPLGQRDEIFRPFPERGKLDLDHVEPVVEILPEPSLLKGFFQIDIRRRDDPDVGPARHVVTEALVLFVLDEPEKFRLEGQDCRGRRR
jgi:hypothetical protein